MLAVTREPTLVLRERQSVRIASAVIFHLVVRPLAPLVLEVLIILRLDSQLAAVALLASALLGFLLQSAVRIVFRGHGPQAPCQCVISVPPVKHLRVKWLPAAPSANLDLSHYLVHRFVAFVFQGRLQRRVVVPTALLAQKVNIVWQEQLAVWIVTWVVMQELH